MMELNKIFEGDALTYLKSLPDKAINCCVTSPPYFNLRDYGMPGQIGLEDTPEKFIENLVAVFREVKRVLCDDGTLWVNIGDSYAAGAKNRTDHQARHNSSLGGGKRTQAESLKQKNKIVGDLKAKDLIGIPWMLAFALRADGWYLRQDIIWSKPNPMPESVTDRCTKSHEYIFLLSKSAKYYYDADSIKTKIADATVQRMLQQIEDQKGSSRERGKTNGTMKAVGPGRTPRKGVDTNGGNQGSAAGIPAMAVHGNGVKGHSGYFDAQGNLIGDGKANKKSVWSVTTKPFTEAHFATFPEELIIDCIKAGCPQCGIVLDPFMGAGTTAIVAIKNNRNFIGSELNPEYIKIAEKRIASNTDLFSLDKF